MHLVGPERGVGQDPRALQDGRAQCRDEEQVGDRSGTLPWPLQERNQCAGRDEGEYEELRPGEIQRAQQPPVRPHHLRDEGEGSD